jgi:hypothetical protein
MKLWFLYFTELNLTQYSKPSIIRLQLIRMTDTDRNMKKLKMAVHG